MRHLEGTGSAFPFFFPDDSKTGDTKAGPAIWEDRAGFEAAAAKLATDAKAAAEASKGGLDAFKAAFGAAAGNCKACHDEYRINTN
jgi:cytochrome c556